MSNKNRIATGLKKIDETKNVVEAMHVELKELEPQSSEKSYVLQELAESLAAEQKKELKAKSVVGKEEVLAKVED